ncbi:DNA gyrase inhibitor YacG [Hydromonas duriensis]|uniref:DNA gyrase inhibitor YacG n=1 Tax=Hydromonas duriensis TaxID=1527608 RepID=A0A4R6Y4N5_9BURK|nr:DNA gyrase inhibitor YacG [Hydromonas duriensis]TDR28807.1 hypothetical protein DFR44_1341 [Hydromonas duriensis]
MPQVLCPSCGMQHEYDTSSTFRPFCSERCKLIDLGAWSQEAYRIPLGSEQGSDANQGAEGLSVVDSAFSLTRPH